MSAETVTFGYDPAGRRTSMTDATGTTQYAYDTATGTLKRVTYPDSRTLQYDYDAQGNRRQLTDPFGANVYYAYDSNNRLASVGSAYQDPTPDASYAYFDNGLIQSVTRKNNVKTAYTYDGLRLDTLTHRKPDNSVLYHFNYDPNRNITSIAEGGVTHTFAYDDLNRIETSSLLGQSFTYGSRGNRATFSSNNPPESPDAAYTFNKRDQLTQVAVTNGPTVQYKYNGDGLLYERAEGGQTTRYYYDGAVVIAKATVTGGVATLKVRYLRGRELVAAEDVHQEKAYYLHNGHGDVIELRDPTGNTTLNRYTYDIWGNPFTSQESVHNPFRYSGEGWDKTTSLQYLRARWYDPSLGRFMSEDTYKGDIANPLSLNLYTYVHNNPLIHVDPTGHWCSSADGKWSHPGDCDFGGGDPELNPTGSYWDGYDYNQNGRWIIENGVQVRQYIYTGSFLDRIVEWINSIGKLTQEDLDHLQEVGQYTGGVLPYEMLNENVYPVIRTPQRGVPNTNAPYWPSNNGFAGTPRTITLAPGTRIDRYEGEGGTFATPAGTPFSQRALPSTSQNAPYHVYEVVQPVQVTAGRIAPWFGQPGGGTQYKFSSSIQTLINQGILKEVK